MLSPLPVSIPALHPARPAAWRPDLIGIAAPRRPVRSWRGTGIYVLLTLIRHDDLRW
jgi:hypothetical protein